MDFTVSLGDIAAFFALLISGYAVWTTTKFNKRQLSLVESQKQLNALLLEQGRNEAFNASKADPDASFVTLGRTRYKLKIWNKGQAAARNVRIVFPDGNDVVIDSEVQEKFPLEVLERFQSVELNAAISMQTKRKHKIRLMRADDFSETNEKVVYPTL